MSYDFQLLFCGGAVNYKHYEKKPVIKLDEREWPSKEITHAPVWCSVDLRDGNQALIEPMVVQEKIEFFKLLCDLGFREIEVGFPSSSQIEYDFLRQLIERDLIPENVTIQVLTQCREHLIKRTFEAIEGAKNVIFHVYNNTSPLHRDVVYGMKKDQIKEIALSAVRLVTEFSKDFPGKLTLEYSPESFNDTELPFAAEVCNAVTSVWRPSGSRKLIINLPATVENSTPNVFADRIEWMSRNLNCRDRIILSVHPHNDRGTGVAATELALLAGAQRVEGTLFGNGERTGNTDIVTLACNLLSQGIDPKLNFDNILEIKDKYERLCKIPVPERQPYAGKLVFTAFSGGHQDAINKGTRRIHEQGGTIWNVPYLPLDPADVGREYEPIVRINSQSGKGGVAYIMEQYHGFVLPKGMHKEFAELIQGITEEVGEVDSDRIMWEFKKNYIDMKEPLHFVKCSMSDIPGTADGDHTKCELIFTLDGEERTIVSHGNGPIDAVKNGLQEELKIKIKVLDYTEHALSQGSTAQAAAYIELLDLNTNRSTYGVGISSNITRASIRAMFSAINRLGIVEPS